MMMLRYFLASLAGAALVIGMAALWLMAAEPIQAAECSTMTASHYGTESGNRTADGSFFDGTSLTAAHRTLPFDTKLKVTYQGKSVVVRVNDRGPAQWTKRDLDLSTAAARKIGLIKPGVAKVTACRL